MIIVDIVLFAIAIMLILYLAYNLIFVVSYPFLRRAENRFANKNRSITINKFAIIIPAHNEELIIQRLIDSVNKLEYPKDRFQLIIIADNCNDTTEEIAKQNDIKCLVRNDRKNTGKPKALSWAFKQINIEEFDAFAIIDADTEMDCKFLIEMNERIDSGEAVIQGYFGIMNPDDTWLTRLMVIPGVLKYKIRYFCKDKLGISCPLMGNGMCFAKRIIERYGWNTYSLTENWEYYLQLLEDGYNVTFNEKAKIYSHAVKKLDHGITQRKRWQKGKILLVKQHFKKLIIRGIIGKDLNSIDSLFELSSPSFSMLLNWTIIYLIAGILVYFIMSQPFHMILSCLLLTLQLLYFMAGMILAKVSWKTWMSVLFVPAFLVWKIGVTILTLKTIRGTKWEKTERKL